MLQRLYIIFETLVGSQAYGTTHKDSDEDLKGVYVEPRDSLLTLAEIPDQFSDKRGEVVHYALRRFLDLAHHATVRSTHDYLTFIHKQCVALHS